MIETIVLNHVAEKTVLPCSMEVPEDPPEEFIVISKAGNKERDHLEYPMLTVDSYAASLFRAAQINEAVKAAMRQLPDETTVSSCKLNNDYNYTDTGEKRYRYRAVFDLVY